jgi:hypothetical protein
MRDDALLGIDVVHRDAGAVCSQSVPKDGVVFFEATVGWAPALALVYIRVTRRVPFPVKIYAYSPLLIMACAQLIRSLRRHCPRARQPHVSACVTNPIRVRVVHGRTSCTRTSICSRLYIPALQAHMHSFMQLGAWHVMYCVGYVGACVACY